MNRISTMVVDDEPLAAQLLGDYVRQTPFLSLEGICSSAVEAFSMWQEHPADLLFLDIQMPQMNGLELSRTLGERSRVIFTTAFEQYALEGFRADALDYLLKPISYAEFLRAAGKARRWFEAGTTGTAPASPEAIPAARNLFERTDYKMQQIRLDDILYIEGMKDYVRIHTAEGGSLVTQTSMKAIEQSGFRSGEVRKRIEYAMMLREKGISIREENPEDRRTIGRVIERAFRAEERSDHREHLLVERLRGSEAFVGRF